MKDYYKILEVQKDASRNEIKKSFRSLAQKYHPDKNPEDDTAISKFKEVNEAYQLLSDEKSRQEYDFMMSGGGSRGMPHDFFGGFNDLFGDLFGSRPKRPRQPSEPTIRITATMTELKSGDAKRSFKLLDEIECEPCNGVGGESREKCNNCKGSGQIVKRVRQGSIMFQTASPCNLCHGTGHVILNVCRTCLGNGFTTKEEIFDVFLTCKRR